MDSSNLSPTVPEFGLLGWLDRAAYGYLDYTELQRERIGVVFTPAIFLTIALVTVAIGSRLSIRKPRNAKAPHGDKSNRWDPIDVDGDKYTVYTKGYLGELYDSMELKHAFYFPIGAAAGLTGLYFLLKNISKETLQKWINIYFVFTSVMPIYSSLSLIFDYSILFISHLFGANTSRFFTRYRLTLSKDVDGFSLGNSDFIDDKVLLSMKEEKSETPDEQWLKKFKQHLQNEGVTIRSAVAVQPENQIYNTYFDLKFLYVGLVAILLEIIFCLHNPFINSNYPFDDTNWILVDILGFFYCVFFIARFRVPNFKIAFALLVGLFFYDIYFVFGTDVMITVATGIKIPMKFVIPTKRLLPENYWDIRNSILGLGDVMLPGLTLALSMRFDLHRAHENEPRNFHLIDSFRKPYFITGIISYICGLLLTFVALLIYDVGQPALLYIVPCMLIAISTVALIRGEFSILFDFTENITEFVDKADQNHKSIEKKSQ